MLVAAPSPHTSIRLSRQSLQIRAADGTETRVPLADIDRLILGSRAALTPAALGALLGRGIPVAVVSTGGRHLGSFDPPSPPRALTRSLQYERSADPHFRLAIARSLIHAKILNSRRALQRLNTRRPTFDPPVLTHFKHLARQLERADSISALRGIEGAAAARYFAMWSHFLPPAFPFGFRSTRPPLNPVNAVLSYLSSLLYGEILSATLSRGLDPAPACLHDPSDDRYSLPLDLMEPFRPALLEPLTLRFFTLGILNERHFKPHGRGTYLNDKGRSLLYEHYEDRLSRRFLDPSSGHRTDFRSLLQESPLDFKIGLGDPTRFQPFRMP